VSTGSSTQAPPASRRAHVVAALYGLFAAIATAVNLGAQAVVLALGGPVLVALAVGTIAGLPVKYVLDKRYIFGFRTTRLSQDGPVFLRYTAMSLVTTLVFWVVEWATHRVTDDTVWTLLGGAVGLVLGYLVKYHLDKRYTFVVRTEETW
jgi:putative flippase GtrA